MADESRLERWFRTLAGKIITALMLVGGTVVVLNAITSGNNNNEEVEFTRDSLITINDSLTRDSDSVNMELAFLQLEKFDLEKADSITTKTLDSLKIAHEETTAKTKAAHRQLARAKTSADSLRLAITVIVKQESEILTCGIRVETCLEAQANLQRMVDNADEQTVLATTDRDKWQKQAGENLQALDDAIAKLQCTIVFGIKCPSRNAAAIGGLVVGLIGGYFIFNSDGTTTVIVQQPPPQDSTDYIR